jgi:hypothetical protein
MTMQTSLEGELGLERVDFYNMIAIELGAPAGWRWFDLKVLGDHKLPREKTSFQMRGAVCDAVYKTGRNKGSTNWTKMDRSTVREFVVSFADYDARVARWECDTGKCGKCFGSGSEVAGGSAAGTAYRTCSKCKGTGKSAAP